MRLDVGTRESIDSDSSALREGLQPDQRIRHLEKLESTVESAWEGGRRDTGEGRVEVNEGRIEGFLIHAPSD